MASDPVHHNAACRLVVQGRVQGVGFRDWTCARVGQEVGVSGWVRNLSSGAVEIFMTGHKSTLESIITACYSGPSLSKVDHIDLAWLDPSATETLANLAPSSTFIRLKDG